MPVPIGRRRAPRQAGSTLHRWRGYGFHSTLRQYNRRIAGALPIGWNFLEPVLDGDFVAGKIGQRRFGVVAIPIQIQHFVARLRLSGPST